VCWVKGVSSVRWVPLALASGVGFARTASSVCLHPPVLIALRLRACLHTACTLLAHCLHTACTLPATCLHTHTHTHRIFRIKDPSFAGIAPKECKPVDVPDEDH
jgi:hypothetical protein